MKSESRSQESEVRRNARAPLFAPCALLAALCTLLSAPCAYASTNVYTATAGTVSVNPTTLQFRASGLVASNGLAQVNPLVTVADETFTNWGTADGITWTNPAGWSSTGQATNGLCDLYSGTLTTPLISGAGLRSVALTWSNLTGTAQVDWSTNGTDWTQLETLTDLRYAWNSYRLRVWTTNTVPP